MIANRTDVFLPKSCNLLRIRQSNMSRTHIISPMKAFYQVAAVAVLLLFVGVSGADCLVPNARMSDAEKTCCQQMAGQCDMSMAAKHPCCQTSVQRHDDADTNDLSHFAAAPLFPQVAILGAGLSPDVSVSQVALPDLLGQPPHAPPTPSVEILRI
ncbi:hypothetical protein HNQ77_000966 [Silvibacterium bohemicum]|uniref:Uncharacterized protein n=1 Tax=Silvibacterium bohemicum TaxID=1577686 RepID=A0A841JNS9_9BACT|nr:hypothetical protein [Silvibacterium bohemicum]